MKIAHTLKRIIMKIQPIRLGKLYKLMLLSEAGYFLKINQTPVYFNDRYEVYEYIQQDIIKGRSIDYLEFGVYTGESLRYWVGLNTNPGTRFFGFDSFKGLPEEWTKVWGSLPEGSFNVDGKIPAIRDPRVNLIKGWFQDTLDGFLRSYDGNDALKVIHMDADLYSSTLYVLTKLDHLLSKGDIIIFDEFSSGDECKAFLDYSSAYIRDFKIVAVSGASYQQVAFVMT
ncbi:TylF/MycF/NovP-related O-methyltransferase [Methanoculleus sp.]|uniref:TylF/MycF/NovP-related O-methyltransferase n=1 Tax=Methanoculleus sp. TaxID=90427 RepID=UPI0025D8E941|nr:TylF/MycF/NovP-related O-methyltransferase [Methanoculleus sp.]